MSVAAEDQRRRSIQWRAVVALVLRAAGIDAEARIPARRTSEVFTLEPSVTTPGLGLHVVAAPIPWARCSVYLNRAVMAADERGGGDLPVLVVPRQQYEPADSYAVLRLADLATLAQDAVKGRSGARMG